MPSTINLRRHALRLILLVCTLLHACTINAQKKLSAAELKKLSVEELMNVRVTLVSRTPQNLTDVASAIQVLTAEDIRRSGATNLPEALRLIPNVQVAQLHSSAWIVGVRGFNTLFSNKLLVMIDGRTVYTPLFGGVIWDLQHVLLEDVERIEVVSGPGGTLWGANAVNGVINVVTRKSSSTQGTYVSATIGDFLRDQFEVRHGGKLGSKSFYRVHGLHMDRRATFLADNSKNSDAWRATQAGFRMDFELGKRDDLAIQGEVYTGSRKTIPEKSKLNGQHLLTSWTHRFNEGSDILLTAYFDRYYREDKPGFAADELITGDLDFQHRLQAGTRHEILWGAGYRYVRDDFKSFWQSSAILPPKKNLDLINGFVQDRFRLTSKLHITAGTKILHNVYTGVEWQPSIRVSFQPNKSNTLWTAVSRAVRTPSRFDRDYFIPGFRVPDTVPSVSGGPNFQSENLTAYEIGYRVQPSPISSFSASAFYNVYTDMYSIELVPGTATYQIMNNTDGKTWGFELTGAYQVFPEWRLRGGYTFIDKKLTVKPGHTFNADYLANDAKHRFLLHSVVDLPGNFEWDLIARYTDKLDSTIATNINVPSFFTFDTRVAWRVRAYEISLVGQNLTKKRHVEFGPFYIPRNLYVKITARF